jgi:hypothetical protein
MPKKGGHSSNLAEEEDEQSSSKQCCFGQLHFSPLICDFFSNYTPNWIQSFNFVQFYPGQTSIQALDFSASFFFFGPCDTIKRLISYPKCKTVKVPSKTRVEPQEGELYKIINNK